MPQPSTALLDPRKSPIHARSTASVEAILEASIQVLLSVGKERLTTSRVAQRAGVSVGTLYQYFPNKSALLQAVLKQHMEDVAEAVEKVCREQKSTSVQQMATALVNTFFAAKMKSARTSVALYFASSDVDGTKIVRQAGLRFTHAIVAMLSTAQEPLNKDPELIASVPQVAMAGISRSILESRNPKKPGSDARRAYPA